MHPIGRFYMGLSLLITLLFLVSLTGCGSVNSVHDPSTAAPAEAASESPSTGPMTTAPAAEAATAEPMTDGSVTAEPTTEESSGEVIEETYQVRLNAHRGYRQAGPDNSFPSFRAAGQLGFWAIEADVHETADGYLVCIHDGTIDATLNGTGAVADLTLEELRS